MRWQGRRQSQNIEDRRGGTFGGPGSTGGGGPRIALGGGGGIAFVVVVLIVGWIAGVDPLTLLSSLDSGGGPLITTSGGGSTSGRVGAPTDEGGQFVAAVLADTEDTWSAIFQRAGERYEPATLVLFRGSTSSACGSANAASGPFYCPGDGKLYIDLAFYDELRTRFHAPGDFAQAYVIAHEVGHHVQDLLGTLGKINALRARSDKSTANALSVRTELQADCYAGVWAHAAEKEGILDVGDIDEALGAASAVGDDTLQKQTQGYVVPDTFTHGTAAQRSRWFKRGYADGSVAACDTFTPDSI